MSRPRSTEGRVRLDGTTEHQIDQMTSPVRCRWCSGVYDLAKVEVTARYTDCSMWKTPCCGHTADDRGETGWKSINDYERIDKHQPRRNPFVTPRGETQVYSGRFPWEG